MLPTRRDVRWPSAEARLTFADSASSCTNMGTNMETGEVEMCHLREPFELVCDEQVFNVAIAPFVSKLKATITAASTLVYAYYSAINLAPSKGPSISSTSSIRPDQ